MRPIISVENISKLYRIGERRPAYRTLSETISGALHSPFQRLSEKFAGPFHPVENGARNDASIWALKDVNFNIAPGEVVGVIGRNGAGKSTLLKILSRITEPTTGQVGIYGRAASLLEVGTGFHGELTGRENVYLSGAILGMRRGEIARKYDEIVGFAEIEKFMDTPVKFYSTGMHMRLAFAVAASLTPEILMIDEVLAVGDAEFQNKCLGKLEESRSLGRTVLFVSHSATMITRLCDRAILLEQGRITFDGDPQAALRVYVNEDAENPGVKTWADAGDDAVRLDSVRVLNKDGEVVNSVEIQEPVSIEVEYHNLQSSLKPAVLLHFINENGDCLFTTCEFNNPAWRRKTVSPGLTRATCYIPGNFFAENVIYVQVSISSYAPLREHLSVKNAVFFQVVDRTRGEGVRGIAEGKWPGLLRPMLEWKIER